MREELIKALELVLEGNWDEAHEIAQSKEGQAEYDRVHALLHRTEGDEWNARYWYNRCGIPFPKISTEEEAKMLLQQYHFL